MIVVLPFPTRSRQFTDANVFEFNRRAFRFHAQIAGARFRAIPARHFFAVHPQAQFAIDRSHIVMIPFAHAALGRAELERLVAQFGFAQTASEVL